MVPVNGHRELVLTLQPASRSVPACSAEAAKACRSGKSRFALCFPLRSGVRVSKPTSDVDYTLRWYHVKALGGDVGIRHGQGPTWSWGIPRAELIKNSLDYEEAVYDHGGELGITDARGTAADGKRWRFLGMFGETARYEDVDPHSAMHFDRILDAVCLVRN